MWQKHRPSRCFCCIRVFLLLTSVYYSNILYYMRILPEPIAFQWDNGNNEKNLKKHNVTTQEAEEMFTSEPLLTVEDEAHSSSREQRFQGLGRTKTNRKLFVAFTIRDKHVRVISVRDMSKKEEQVYEKTEKDS